MLKEITLKEAAELMEKGEKVYGVEIGNYCSITDLGELLGGCRFLVDTSEKKKGGRPKNTQPPEEQEALTEKEIEDIAKEIDQGKIMALKKAGWTNLQIADEFGFTAKTMNRILDKLQ